MVSRTYRRCSAITARGERCRANSVDTIDGHDLCPLHLPPGDKRRIAAVESNRQRTKAYWDRRRLAQAIANAAPPPKVAA